MPGLREMTDRNQSQQNERQSGSMGGRTATNTRRQMLGAIVGVGLAGAMFGQSTAQGSNGQPPDPDDYEDILTDMDGDGSENDPYVVTTVHQLQAIEGDLTARYVLGNSIDASQTRNWNNSKGFDPISEFAGAFDGKGFEIKRLYIDRPEEIGVGLFRVIDFDAGSVSNLILDRSRIVGENAVGTLAGASNSDIENVTARRTEVEGNVNVGGLLGNLDGEQLTDSEATGTVVGESNVGGAVGYCDQRGLITKSSANVTVEGGRAVGGIVGQLFAVGFVTKSHATGDVSGNEGVGGLAGSGLEDSRIRDSYATGNVTGESAVGGLVGDDDDIDIARSYATGSVSGNEKVGGLLGEALSDDVDRAYATGDVTGETEVGGLVGKLGGDRPIELNETYAAGSVDGDENVGGLIGAQEVPATVTDSYWDRPATGQAESDGGVGLGDPEDDPPAEEMTGETAEDTLEGFDFDNTWTTVVDPDEYPRLIGVNGEVVFWQVDFAEGTEPPSDPEYWPNDLMAALGNSENGVTRNPAPRRQQNSGQLGDVSILDNEFQFDDPASPTEVSVQFELDSDADPRDLHLAVFTLPGPFDEDEIDEQELFENSSDTYEGDDAGELTVSIPQEVPD